MSLTSRDAIDAEQLNKHQASPANQAKHQSRAVACSLSHAGARPAASPAASPSHLRRARRRRYVALRREMEPGVRMSRCDSTLEC